jgi:hypothetical protein
MVRPASVSSPDRRAIEEANERRRDQLRRRLEESRRRAEQARDRARAAQQNARSETTEARQAAREARREDTTVRRTERELRDAERRDPDGDKIAELRTRLARERGSAEHLRDAATRAQTRADTAKDDAIIAADHALDAQRSANRAFEARGERAPFELADQVEDVYDAGSLSDRDQEKLFGARSVVSPEEAAETDAGKVELATDISPENGAAMLRLQMENNPDPRYRRALAGASGPAVEAIGEKLANDDATTTEAARSALRDLSRAAELGGPGSFRPLAESFARHVPERSPSEPLTHALREVARSDAGASFGRELGAALSSSGKYDAADSISRLDRRLQPGGLDRGERAAADAIRVDESPARAEREQLSRDLDAVEKQTKSAVDRTFDRADGGRLPHGAEVTSRSGNSVEIERRDNKGRILWRESATRDGDQLHWERTDFRGGFAERKSLESGGEAGTTVRRERWKEAASKDPTDPSTEQLKSSAACDKNIAVQEQSVRRDGDSLISREGSWDKNGRSELEKTHRTQTGSEGIQDTPAEDFDDDRRTTVVETNRVDQKWGEEEKRLEEVVYSQGNIRATSQIQHDAADDIEDEDDARQWTLEKQEDNVYRSQTFVEGAPQITSITTRTARGRSIHEEIESHGLDEEGEETDASSTTDSEYDRRGVIVRKTADVRDENGVHTTQDFRREEERTERGVEVRERTKTSRTEPGEEGDPPATYASDREVRSLIDGRSTKLLSTKETIDGPDGTATSVVDENGPRLTVNGVPTPISEASEELDRLREGDRELAAQATADTFRDVKRFAALGAGGLSLVSIGKGASDPALDSRLSAVTRERLDARLDAFNQRLTSRFGGERVSSAFRAQTAGLGAAKGIGGVVGLASAAFGLSNNVDSFNMNKAQAALDVGNATTGGSQGVAAAKEVSALKAGASVDEATAAAGKFATFAKFGGLATGAGAGAFEVFQGIQAKDGVQIAQGGVTMAGAVGGFAVAGAIGGPAGMAAGAAIGLAAFGIHQGIGAIFGDDEPKVAEKAI